MAVNINPTTAPAPVSEEAAAAPGWTRRRTVILIVAAAVLFAGTYGLAWLTAFNLTQQYLRDADVSYGEGNYLGALVGYEEFDRSINRYVNFGGYMHVERIWSNRYAIPVPTGVERARARIDEIVNERLTIEDAEQFVSENIGRNNPYLGFIYLRLGELYEADGQTREALEIYEGFADNFRDQTELIARAEANLARLQAAEEDSE